MNQQEIDVLKAKVAATMGASPSVRVLIDEITDKLAQTMQADGLSSDSKTAEFVAQLRTEAPSLAHLAEIGTRAPRDGSE